MKRNEISQVSTNPDNASPVGRLDLLKLGQCFMVDATED